MDILLETVTVVWLLLSLMILLMWLSIKLARFIVIMSREVIHQVALLKHRPRLWWQFHKKYRSCADPMLELDSAAVVDMTEEEFKEYYRKLHELREKVYCSSFDNSGVCVFKGYARCKQTMAPPESRYDDVFKEDVDWLNKQC
jgi:hypothetical protein